MPIPRLLFPVSESLKDQWLTEETAYLFEDNNLVIHCDRGSYVPEFDTVEPAVKGLTQTFTPYHRINHARFTVTCQDNRAFIYWILKQLEADSLTGTTYTPIACVDYVLPDLANVRQGYSERLSAQFHCWTEGAFLIKGDYSLYDAYYDAYVGEGEPLTFPEWEARYGDRYFDKISFTYEILRVGA